jgi:hypothetical protein
MNNDGETKTIKINTMDGNNYYIEVNNRGGTNIESDLKDPILLKYNININLRLAIFKLGEEDEIEDDEDIDFNAEYFAVLEDDPYFINSLRIFRIELKEELRQDIYKDFNQTLEDDWENTPELRDEDSGEENIKEMFEGIFISQWFDLNIDLTREEMIGQLRYWGRNSVILDRLNDFKVNFDVVEFVKDIFEKEKLDEYNNTFFITRLLF